mmetsp:Transcript_13159/g.28886  ORF Transcript_13159/g.28886 Transcript_13159/m.28886 type:complete len:211 (+) Transcript_13159:386-1018(+)
MVTTFILMVGRVSHGLARHLSHLCRASSIVRSPHQFGECIKVLGRIKARHLLLAVDKNGVLSFRTAIAQRVQRRLQLLHPFQILGPLQTKVAQILILHQTNRLVANGRVKLLLFRLLRLLMLPIANFALVHAKVEFIGIAHGRLLFELVDNVLLLVIILGPFDIVLFLFEDSQVRAPLGLRPFLVGDSLDGIAERRHLVKCCVFYKLVSR